MKTSQYNISVEKNGVLLLYNTKTSSFVKIDSPHIDIVKSIMEYPNDCFEKNNEIYKNLRDGGFIVDDSTDEFGEIRDFFQRYRNKSDIMILTIIPSETCNFSCPYCVVYKKRNIRMNENMYNACLKYIQNNMTGKFDLRINWFGGEPTLEKRNILKFCNSLNEIAQKNNFLNIEHLMTTNGYLLSKNDFLEYVNVGINRFQITLDGYGEQHDQTRYLANGKGTFEHIANNLLQIKTLPSTCCFEIVIRHNFLRKNFENSLKLLEFFNENFGDDRRFTMYSRPVYKFSQEKNEIKTIEDELCDTQEGIIYQFKMDAEYFKKVKNEEYNLPLPEPLPLWCDTAKTNFFIIGANGNIYKCDSYFGDDSKSVGVLNDNGEIIFNQNIHKWNSDLYSGIYGGDGIKTECTSCKMLPICQGGCLRVRIEGDSPCFYNETRIKELMYFYYREMEGSDDVR